MRIDLKILKKLSVETKSGVKLGTVYDLVLNTDGQMIAQYLVKSSMVSQKIYRINRDQVINITAEKIMVEDGILKEKNVFLVSKRISTSPPAVAMRTE